MFRAGQTARPRVGHRKKLGVLNLGFETNQQRSVKSYWLKIQKDQQPRSISIRSCLKSCSKPQFDLVWDLSRDLQGFIQFYSQHLDQVRKELALLLKQHFAGHFSGLFGAPNSHSFSLMVKMTQVMPTPTSTVGEAIVVLIMHTFVTRGRSWFWDGSFLVSTFLACTEHAPLFHGLFQAATANS